jgi:soluble lytic murein transglycosylase-like protein
MAARYYHIDPLSIKAILLIESSLDANAINKASACGIAQFICTTACDIGIANHYDRITSIWGCVASLRRLCDPRLMVSAYNYPRSN